MMYRKCGDLPYWRAFLFGPEFFLGVLWRLCKILSGLPSISDIHGWFWVGRIFFMLLGI